MKLGKKDIKFLILYTIVLLFAFLYIKDIISIMLYVLKIFMPFLIGIGIAFVLNCLVNLIENKWLDSLSWSKSTKRAFSLTVSILLVLGFFILLLLLIIPNLYNAIAIFANSIPEYLNSITNMLENFNVSENIIAEISEAINTLGQTASKYVISNSKNVIETTFGIASNVVTGVVNVFIGFVFAIYYLVDKEHISGQIKKVMDAYIPKKRAEKITEIGKLSNKVFEKFVSGQCIEAIIIGVLCFSGMIILRLPYASTISVLVGFTALIPVFGAFIGTILGALLIFMINPLQALIFVIFILVLQQLEGNLIYPYVVGKQVGLPAIWVLVAVTIGASLSGIIGMLLSVPLASIMYSIIKVDVHKRLEKNTSK